MQIVDTGRYEREVVYKDFGKVSTSAAVNPGK
jgi:hypothetical protein